MRGHVRGRPRGAVLIMVIVCLFVLTIVFGVLVKLAFAERKQARAAERRLQAIWLAESGLERAWAKLSASGAYLGETWEIPAESLRSRDGAVVRIVVERVDGDSRRRRVTARADFPREGPSRARETRTTEISVNEPAPGEE